MADTYNVFISWSGERSKGVAAALYDWLPMVVQSARPWMSEEDIEKGSRGLEEIGKALESMSVGIICLTPENLEKPWILFETGALSKALGDKTRVCPYLFGDLRPENVKPPLGMFQATAAVKDDTRKLVSTVNRVLGGSLVEEKLDTLFEGMWGVLEGKLNGIGAAAGAVAPHRSEREMLAEVLELSRAGASKDKVFMDGLGALVGTLNTLLSLGGAPGFQALQDELARISPTLRLRLAAEPTNEQAKEEPQKERRRMHAPSLKRAGRPGKTGDERK